MTDTWTWATVTQASPLRIKVDGDTTALDATTDNLVGSLAVLDRVRVHLHADGIIVTGLQGGAGGGGGGSPEATAATPNTLALRNFDGRAQFSPPVDFEDAATKGYVDANSGGTPEATAATPDTLALRDGDGRTQFASPLLFAWTGTPNASESVLKTVAGTEVRRNLVRNPSVESDIVGWVPTNGFWETVVTRTASASAAFGGYVLRHTLSDGDYGNRPIGGSDSGTSSADLTAGVEYTGSIYVRPSIDMTLYAELNFRDSGGGAVSNVNADDVFCPAGQWTRLTKTATPPATTVYGGVRVKMSGIYTWDSSTYIDLDGMFIEQSSTLGDYFDGSQNTLQQANQVATVEYVQALIAAL